MKQWAISVDAIFTSAKKFMKGSELGFALIGNSKKVHSHNLQPQT
ncbi:hypothetical protein LECLMA074M_04430 [Leclercia sp. M-A074-M]